MVNQKVKFFQSVFIRFKRSKFALSALLSIVPLLACSNSQDAYENADNFEFEVSSSNQPISKDISSNSNEIYVCDNNKRGLIIYIATPKDSLYCNGSTWIQIEYTPSNKESEASCSSSSQKLHSSSSNKNSIIVYQCNDNTFVYNQSDCNKIKQDFHHKNDEKKAQEDSSLTQTCSENDIKYIADTTYSLCQKGEWVNIPASLRFLNVEQGKFLPEAQFTVHPFTLKPPLPQNQGVVRCTFNGVEPDTNSQVFSENKLIEKTTVVRCTEFVKNKATQKQNETYFINENIHMPVISISVDPYYVSEYLDAEPCTPKPCKSAKFWEDTEYPTHVEYFANGSLSSKKDFEIDAGISVAGGWSRNEIKKSVSIVIRKEYQNGKLHYPLYETRPFNNKIKSFNLRNNGNRFISDYIEDAVATSLLEGTNVDYQRSRQVVVFYNGQYRGIYDMREKLNEHFVETNYGISDDVVDFIKHGGTTIKVQNGSSTDYQDMLQYISSHNFEANDSAYQSVLKMLDMSNYMEYMAAEIYYHNGDWPHNNVRVWKSPNTSWKYIAFDIDHGFDWTKNVTGFSQDKNMIDWILSGGNLNGVCHASNNHLCFHNIFVKLHKNSTFKQAFINRAAYLYSTYLNSKRVAERVDSIYNSIDINQITRDQKIYPRPYYRNSCGTGFDAKGKCLKNWASTRDNSVRDELRKSFDLGKDIPITIKIKGTGRLKLNDANISQSDTYKWTVFKGHPIKLTAECYAGAEFMSWENGSKNPNREIVPTDSAFVYTAKCN